MFEGILEEWNVIPLREFTKKPAETSWSKTEKYPRENFEEFNNPNYALVCGNLNDGLFGLDVDFPDEWSEAKKKKAREKLIPILEKKFNTLLIQTCSGNIHIFFKGDSTFKNKFPNYKIKGNTKHGLKEARFKGTGGYLVIPPSYIIDKTKGIDGGYSYINKKPIRVISKSYLKDIIEFFVVSKEYVHSKKKNTSVKGKVREPFRKLLMGELDIDFIKNLTGKEEFVYWKYLFIEYIAKGYTLNYITTKLKKFQPSFDWSKAKDQINFHVKNNIEHPLTNKMIEEYFPKDEQPSDTELLDDLEEDYNMNWLVMTQEIVDEVGASYLIDSNQYCLIKNKTLIIDDKKVIDKAIFNKIKENRAKSYRNPANEILRVIKDSRALNREDHIIYEPFILKFKNGIYDCYKDKFYLNDEWVGDKLFFYEIPYNYEPDYSKNCDEFNKACIKWFGIDEETTRPEDITLNDVYEAIGYTLQLGTGLKAFFILYGVADTGKTQFAEVLLSFFPKANRSEMSIQRIQENDFGLGFLDMKVINYKDDMGSDAMKTIDRIKEITGGKTELHGEVKNGGRFSFPLTVKFWAGCNVLPYVMETEGLFNRMILFKFEHIFSKKTEPNDFKISWSKRTILNNPDEIQGIIHNAIEGLKRLAKRESFRPELKRVSKHKYLEYADSVYRFFKANYKKVKLEAIKDGVRTTDFHDEYNRYFYEDESGTIEGTEPEKPAEIKKRLERIGIFRDKSGGVNYYADIVKRTGKEVDTYGL